MSGCSQLVHFQPRAGGFVASSESVNLGSVALGQSASVTVSLTNSDVVALKVTKITISGQSFKAKNQPTLPATVAPGRTITLAVNFVPTVTGVVDGKLSVVSDSALNSTTIVELSGTGAAASQTSPLVSALTCNQSSVTGAGSDGCYVSLGAQAPTGGTTISLSSNNAAATVPTKINVPVKANVGKFTVDVASVVSTQAVTITATSGNQSKTFNLSLIADVPSLRISATSIAFGSVSPNKTYTQTLTLTSIGTAPLTINSVSSPAKPFSLSSPGFPRTLSPGNSTTVLVNFLPTSLGAAAGQVTITSDSSLGEVQTVSLSGTGSGPDSFGYTGSPMTNTLIPPNPTTPISGDFFGMTIRHTFTPFPTFPVSTLRFWDVAPWEAVEPTSGQFVWSELDEPIAIGQKNGVSEFIFTFGNIPVWASTNPTAPCADGPGTCAPPNMEAFDDFATQLVQRYCGTIKNYETWNEPNDNQYWSGTNAQLLTVAQHLYEIAKNPSNCGCAHGVCTPNGGTNPNQVLMPPISRINPSNLSWLDSYLSTSGSKYPFADIASFHGYGSESAPEDIVGQVQALNLILAKHGLSKLQTWNTEADWGPKAVVGDEEASWLMRYHAALATTGVSRFVWYAYDTCSWGTLWEGYCPNAQMPVENITEGGDAYATIENWLSGASLPSCQVYENGLWACELERSNGYKAWMLWSSTGAGIEVPMTQGSGMTIYLDRQNNSQPLPTEITVNQMPVLIENQQL